jgi:hypothetical protein
VREEKNMKIQYTKEQLIRKCPGCLHFDDDEMLDCTYTGKKEFGKYGKCLKRRKR